MIKRIVWLLAGLVLGGIALIMVMGQQDTSDPAENTTNASRVDVSDRRGALVDEVVFTQETDVGKVAGLIERGTHQVFAQGVTNTTTFHRLQDSSKGDYETAYGSNTELTLNPAEFKSGLNPFSNRRIREAMNWLVNRRHVAEEIYGGMAVRASCR